MRNIGAWTDIYALGATLYNLTTLRNPPTFDEIINEESNAFSFPAEVSSPTRNLIVKMMNVNRNERPQNVEMLLSLIIKDTGKGSIAEFLNYRNPTKAPYFVYMLVSVICSVFVTGLSLIIVWFIFSPFRDVLISLNISPDIGAFIFAVSIILVLFFLRKVNLWLIKRVCSYFYK